MIKFISLSGGKDSTALMIHAILTKQEDDSLHFIFCDTGNEHPLTYSYVNYLDSILEQHGYDKIIRLKADFTEQIKHKHEWLLTKDHPDWQPIQLQKAIDNLQPSYNPFLDLCLYRGRFPSSLTRFCTQELKIFPTQNYIKKFLAQGYDCENWVGIRKDESRARAKLPREELYLKDESTGAECYTVRPLLDWTAKDCFDYLKKFGVDPNPLYAQGMKRVGCMPCINCTKAELKEIAARFPSEIYRIEAWEKQVSASCRRGSSTFFYDKEGGTNKIWQKVDWSKGDKTGDLFEEDFVCCKSYYGLCE